ncbi:MAG TPA: hypothetical protein VHD60_00825 [Candidatus Saccharimonadales bacterium]|nr:hypothetical protein [Candidatus Saccharimonadales bacterium]
MKKIEKYTAVAGLTLICGGIGAVALENGRVPGMHQHHASKPIPVAAAKQGGHGQSLPELATLAADLQPAPPAPSQENSALTTAEGYLTFAGVIALGVAIVPDIKPSRRQSEAQPDTTPPMLPTQPSAGESTPVM